LEQISTSSFVLLQSLVGFMSRIVTRSYADSSEIYTLLARLFGAVVLQPDNQEQSVVMEKVVIFMIKNYNDMFAG
jgi:hypothetical protein